MLNLDAHILVFARSGKLAGRELQVLSRDRWSISAIVLWELAKLYQLGRTRDRRIRKSKLVHLA